MFSNGWLLPLECWMMLLVICNPVRPCNFATSSFSMSTVLSGQPSHGQARAATPKLPDAILTSCTSGDECLFALWHCKRVEPGNNCGIAAKQIKE